MYIIFEKFSWLHFLLLLPFIRKINCIFILQPNPYWDKKLIDIKGIKKLLKILLPRLKVKKLEHKDFHEACFTSHIKLLSMIDKHEIILKKSLIFRKMLNQYEKDKVLLGIKKGILSQHYNSLYLATMAKSLSVRDKVKIYVIPTLRDRLGIFRDLKTIQIHTVSYAIIFLKDHFRSLYHLIRYLGYLIVGRGGLYGVICSMFLKKNSFPIKVKYAIQVVWGFNMQFNVGTNKHTRWDNSFLEDNDEFSGKNLLYVHFRSDKPVSSSLEYLRNKTSFCCDQDSLLPNWKYFIIKMLFPSLKLTILFFYEWILFRLSSDFIISQVRIIYYIHLYERFVDYYRPKVYLAFDDQSTACIARDIVFLKYGIKTACIPHSSLGGLVTHPDLAYISFDRLFAFSKKWEEMFSPYWNEKMIEVVGVLKSDLIFESMRNSTLREEYIKKYGRTLKKILVCPAYPETPNLKSRSVDFYKSLLQLLEIRDDIIIIFRPRDELTLNEPYIYNIIKPALDSGRMRIELEDFDTWELIAFSDVIISSQNSSVLCEAISAGKNAFSYSYCGIDKLLSFYQLNSKLLATDAVEVIERVIHFIDNDEGFENLVELQKSIGPEVDGHTLNRIRKSLTKLAEEK